MHARINERAVLICILSDGVPCVGVGKAWSKMDIYSCGSILNTHGDAMLKDFVIFAFYQVLAAGTSGVYHGADRLLLTRVACV